MSTFSRQVTVLMPAYNAGRTIESAIRSVMAQTYRDWTLLVIDDGSTDETGMVCRRISSEDSRVVYYPSEHIGFSPVLNLGLQLIDSQYVARLDADDISHPERLAKQMSFLEAKPHVKVLGTWGERINNQGRSLSRLQLGAATEEQHRELVAARKPVFLIHSSVVADRETLLQYGGFREEEYPSDDIWLWTRIAQDHPVLAIPENLVGYRISAGGISNQTLWRMILQWARCEYNLQHEQPLDMASFTRMIESDPWLHRRYRLGFWHKFAFRTGAYHFYNERRVLGSLYLAAGAALNPTHVFRRLLQQS